MKESSSKWYPKVMNQRSLSVQRTSPSSWGRSRWGRGNRAGLKTCLVPEMSRGSPYALGGPSYQAHSFQSSQKNNINNFLFVKVFNASFYLLSFSLLKHINGPWFTYLRFKLKKHGASMVVVFSFPNWLCDVVLKCLSMSFSISFLITPEPIMPSFCWDPLHFSHHSILYMFVSSLFNMCNGIHIYKNNF